MSVHSVHLLLMVFAAIAVLIALISLLKLHPFVSLIVVSMALGLAVRMPLGEIVSTFEQGVGYTLGHVAIVVGLGTILGKLLAESGGADVIARTLVDAAGKRGVPWAMLGVGLITGLPVFFEVGFVLMIPLAFTVAKRSGLSVLHTALPLLAGLSIVHAMVPPHPAAMAAVVLYNANISRTLLYALLVGVPAAVLAGPVFAGWVVKRVRTVEGDLGAQFVERDERLRAPGFALTVATVLLPIGLMLMGGWARNPVLRFLGGPDMALLIGVLVAMVTLGAMHGVRLGQMQQWASESLPATAGALLLIGAGGGFGKLLQASGVGAAILELATHAHLPLLVMAWLIAALLRVSVGSSTVAMTTAAGIIAPAAAHVGVSPELLVIATGAGSIVLSHVNDGGFWLVKSYLNLSVADTLRTWTVLETVLSVMGLAGALALSAVR